MAELKCTIGFSGDDDIVLGFFLRREEGGLEAISVGESVSLSESTPYELIGFVAGPAAAPYEVSISVSSSRHAIKASRNPVKKRVPDGGKGWFTQPFTIQEKELS